MKRKMRIRFLFSILSFFFWVSCSQEIVPPKSNNGSNEELPDGTIRYSLYAQEEGFLRPITRTGSADEEAISGDMWVFVFDASATDPIFLEAVKADDHSSVGSGASMRNIVLTKRTHEVSLLILANAPASFFNGTSVITVSDEDSWGLTPQVSKMSDAQNLLNTVQLTASTHPSVPYTTPADLIPLSVVITRPKLDLSTQFGSVDTPLGLLRMVAKLTVSKAFEAVANYVHPAFEIKGVTVCNAPRNASFFPIHKSNVGNLTHYFASGAGNEITDIATAVANSTLANPLYVYPSHESVTAHQPYLILQARYDTDLNDTYYKLYIAPVGKPVGWIERNTSYLIQIESCSGRGYSSIAEAMSAPPSNLIYSVDVSDLTSHDVIDNGQYFLGVSNSEYHLYASNGISSLVVATLHTGSNSGAESFVGNVLITSSDPSKLNVDNASITHPAVDQPIRIDVSDDFVEGYLTLRLGNLTKVIKVKRMANSFIEMKDELVLNTNYIDALYKVASVANPCSWMKVGFSSLINLHTGMDVASSSVGGVYICYNSFLSNSASDNSVYISRGNGEGRIKAHFILAPSISSN